MVELQPSKLVTRVRFPSPAPEDLSTKESQPWFFYFNKIEGIEPTSFITYDKQHAYGALVITRFRCSLAFIGKLMRFALSDNLLRIKSADSE